MQRFLDVALDVVPRVLGLCDRRTESATAGCCDRNFWHYRLLDVPNARFQEIGILLALAHSTRSPSNPFFGNPKIADWVRLIWKFWLTRRNSDGSVAEVYPFERSFCATSFSAAAFTETVRLMGGASAWESELTQARNTFVWLAAQSNPGVANQMLASWHALQGYVALTGDPDVAVAAARRREACLALQDSSGVWPEYGGFDSGYQTISMSTLACLAELTPQDTSIESALEKADIALRNRISAEGEVASGYNSRGTQYLYPHAFARSGSPILERLQRGLENRLLLRPTWLDDRYCHALASDYFLAYRAASCR